MFTLRQYTCLYEGEPTIPPDMTILDWRRAGRPRPSPVVSARSTDHPASGAESNAAPPSVDRSGRTFFWRRAR